MMKEIFDWLEKYQGPVECAENDKTVASIAKRGDEDLSLRDTE
jgi:hypothetical protein